MQNTDEIRTFSQSEAIGKLSPICAGPSHSDGRERILNECSDRILSTSTPDDALEQILSLLGENFCCDRVYIFEFNKNDTISNTYEWCAPSVNSNKLVLHDIPKFNVGYWLDMFMANKVVVIDDLESIKTRYPSTYSIIKSQDIRSVIASVIRYDGEIKGFIGVDNPDPEQHDLIVSTLGALGNLLAFQLRYRDLHRTYVGADRHDALTGALNSRALYEDEAAAGSLSSLGVVYCKLKLREDIPVAEQRPEALQGYDVIRRLLTADRIYRTGLCEFVAIYPNTNRESMLKDIKLLRLGAARRGVGLSVGYSWSDQKPISLYHLIVRADNLSYLDLGPASPDCRGGISVADDLLSKFLERYYYDLDFFLAAITANNDNGFFYFGDMQENIFYISDNMRERFGFDSNVVPDLLTLWAQRIPGKQSLQRYWESIRDMMDHKTDIHHLRYRVTDKDGENVWIHCYGRLQWNEDQTKPLFFAGRVTKQDENFSVDSVTNFPWETVLLRQLNSMEQQGISGTLIGFSLNNIGQINSIHGRSYGDKLIRSIADTLVEKLGDKMSFYRISGVRCAGILKNASENPAAIVEQIKSISEKKYAEFGIPVKEPCSLAVLHYPQADVTTIDFFENMIALIRAAHNDMERYVANELDVNMQQLQQSANMALVLNRDVLHGMENFRAVVQPLVSASTGRVVGGETLLRWRFHGKDVPPSVFIPILEQEGVIHLVGRWVFDQAVLTCKRILCYNPHFYLTVNVSLHQLNDEGFTDHIRNTLKKYGLGGKHLVMEMTESCMDTNSEKLMAFVNSCRDCGIRIALDDFGTGYSSMRVLLQYPSSIIKLDRSLLLEMTETREKMNFVSSIVYACHQFGKKVCIEGVETELQNSLTKETGCDVIQGFYYYRPLELDDLYKAAAGSTPASDSPQ